MHYFVIVSVSVTIVWLVTTCFLTLYKQSICTSFSNQSCAGHRPACAQFLETTFSAQVYASVYVCVYVPEAINN